MLDARTTLSDFGRCVMDMARTRGLRSQVAIRRALIMAGLDVPERTFANYLYGRVVVDPRLPAALVSALRLNKREMRELAMAYAFGQPPRRNAKREGRRREGERGEAGRGPRKEGVARVSRIA
jgi:hypothetical protein